MHGSFAASRGCPHRNGRVRTFAKTTRLYLKASSCFPPDLTVCPLSLAPDGPASCKRPDASSAFPVSSGPWAPVAFRSSLTGRKQQSVSGRTKPACLRVCSTTALGCGGRDRAGTERMRVRRRLFGHPLDAYVCCFAFRPSFVCLGKGEKHAFGGHLPICLGVAPIRYAFSTVSHGDHTFTCQSACHALRQKGRWQAANSP